MDKLPKDASGSKLDAAGVAVKAGDWPTAIRLAAKAPGKGPDRDAILDGATALSSPAFLRAVKKDPEACIEAAKAALRRRYAAQLGDLV